VGKVDVGKVDVGEESIFIWFSVLSGSNQIELKVLSTFEETNMVKHSKFSLKATMYFIAIVVLRITDGMVVIIYKLLFIF
jgi:hypothetical protein